MAWPYQEMDALCRDVRLDRRDDGLASAVSGVDVPEGAALWEGTYAAVLLWPGGNGTGLDEAAIAGQSWLDERIYARETRTSPIDGYLVLAISEPPSTAATALVTRIELSTQVCRKQVIWPSAAAEMGWRGLTGVSVLGFPGRGEGAEVDTWPEMDPESAALWARIEASGHAQVAEEDRAGDAA